MSSPNKVGAGEWQPSSGFGFVQPPTEMLPKLTAAVPAKGIGLGFDKTDGLFKIPSGDYSGRVVIVKMKAPLVADDPDGAKRVECWTKSGHRYTVIAGDAIDPQGYAKLGAGGKFFKWISGTDADAKKAAIFDQRPNHTPPQNSGSSLLEACEADEVIGVTLLEGAAY